jgi:CubicO group peptidase (beta-lactamase class C family)
VDENTLFQLGSATKPLTASGIGLLVQQGKVKWDTPISELWPRFQVRDASVTKQATLRDILCHRTGVGKGEGALYYNMPTTRRDLLARLPQMEQVAPFRTEWRYSNLMYSAAGGVLEEMSGESWDDYMSKRVFQPLGMAHTKTSVKSLSGLANVAVPHVRVGSETFATEFADQDNIAPAAAVCSSVADLSEWLLMMVSGGRHSDRQFLETDVVNEMLRPHILAPADPVHGKHAFNAYGLGMVLWDYHGGRIAAHSGMAGHSVSMIGFAPEHRVGVVVLVNHRRCLFHYAAFQRALDLYCGLPLMDLDSPNKRLIDELAMQQDQGLKRREALRDPNKKASLPVEKYSGKYVSRNDSMLCLSVEAGELILRHGIQVANVSHWHNDTFRARLRERRLAAEQDWWLSFTVEAGVITRLHIHSEHDIHDDFVPQASEG